MSENTASLDASNYFVNELHVRILNILKQQPGVPFSVITLAEMLGMTPLEIDNALEEIEGPVPGSEEPGAYLYVARNSNQAVYIP